MIPKKIHYCWFGGKEKTDLINKCIESWKKYLPDFEIIEWNENNYDIRVNEYVSTAYDLKKWAFVSDYARFDVLDKYGGIYLDTDVELLKPLPSDFLEKRGFSCVEQSGLINPGLVFATEPKLKILQEILSTYDSFNPFGKEGKINFVTVNSIVTPIFVKKGFIIKDVYQKIEDFDIYQSEIFCGFDLDVMEPNITENTISIHHYNGSWNSNMKKQKIQKALKKAIGIEGYRKLLNIVRSIRNEK